MDLSLLIAYHEEGIPEIMEAITSLKETIDIDSYEIIVIDDCSSTPLSLDEENVTVVRQQTHLGVGRVFMLGAKHAQSENLWIQGGDIRYGHNNWASQMIEAVDKNPKSVICTLCVGMNKETPDGMNFEVRRKKSRRNASTILFYHDHKSHSKMPVNYRDILQCQWLPINTTTGLVEVPSVLGAAYIVKKAFFDYIDPWSLHRSWGGLEPQLSLSAWLKGGSYLCNHDVETGHIFKRGGTHGTPLSHVRFNKIVAAHTLFPEDLAETMINYMASATPHPDFIRGKMMFDKQKDSIFAKRDEYKGKITVDVREWATSWGIDLRNA